MKRVYKILFEVIFFMILASGVLLTAAHFAIQELNLFRAQVVHYIEDRTGFTVTIGAISTEWHGITPSFQLENISFQNADMTGELKQLNIDIDLYRSLLQGRYQLGHFTIDGMELHLNHALSQLFKPNSGLTWQNNSLAKFLFHQFSDVDLKNVSIYTTQANGNPVQFTIPQLHWVNQGEQHQGQGTVEILGGNQPYGQLSLQLNLHDNAGEIESGIIYLAADKIDITPWNSTELSDKIKLTQGNLSLRTWVNIQQGKVKHITTVLPSATLDWQDSQQQTHQLALKDQQLYLTHTTTGWSLDIPKIRLSIDGQALSDLPMVLQWRGDDLYWYNFYQSKQLELQISSLNLQQFSPLVGLFSPLYPKFYQQWQRLQPSGEINQLALSLNLAALSKSRLRLKWYNASWRAAGKIPGMTHLSGEVNGSLAQGTLVINTQDASLNYPTYLPDSIPIEQLQAAINWQDSVTGLQVTAKNLMLKTPSLLLKGAAAYTHRANMAPWLSIAAGINLTDARAAYHFYPKGLMSNSVIQYLTDAIQGGTAQNGVMLFSGDPTHFPYHSTQQGLFQVYIPLEQANFQFNSDWPRLTNSNLILNFLNDGLKVSSVKLDLNGIQVSDLTAKIPHYSAQKLYIDGNVAGQGSVIANYFSHTPLKASLGAALQQVQVKGAVSGKLKLAIPFDKQQHPVVSGEILLPDNNVSITPIATQFQQVKGKVSFINGQVDAKNLTAQWAGQPINLNLATTPDAQNYQINLGIKGNWSAKQLPLPSTITQQLSGSSRWNMQVAVNIPNNSNSPSYHGTLKGDLSTIVSQLPAPLNMVAQQGRNLQLQVTGKGDNFNLQGNIGDNAINSQWQVDAHQIQLQKFIWQAQQQKIPTLPKSSLAELNLPVLNLDLKSWLAYVTLWQGESNFAAWTLPKQIMLNTQNLSLFNQQWDNLQLIYQTGQARQIIFKGTDIDGSLQMPQGKPWDLNLTYLYLNPGGFSLADLLPNSLADQSTHKTLQIQSLSGYPSLKLNCQDCWLFGQRLNKLSANIVTTPQALNLTDGIIDTGVGKLQLSLNWKLGTEQTTQLTAKLSGNNLTDFNQFLNIPPSVSAEEFDFESNLRWQGAPWQPQIKTLNGTLSGKIGKGAIHSVQMGRAGKILSVLSLEALVRQLQSDFKEVFDNGFYFNDISSQTSIKNGVMQLNQVEINGLAAYISLLGDIDLNDNRLKVEAKVTPEISAGVGIATAFAVNPLAGVFAYVGSKLFSPIWRNIFLVRYAITGSITDPKIAQKEIKTRTAAQQ